MQTFRDAYRFRHVLLALAAKQLKVQYRNMSLGFFWALLNPLVMVTVLSLVIVFFFGAGPEQPARVVVALVPYNFFVYCLSGGARAITGNVSLVKKVFFPRQILPFSIVLSSLAHLAVQSVLIVLVLLCFPTPGDPIGLHLLWLAPILVVLVGLCAGVALLFAALTVAIRDMQYFVQSLANVLFWLSPVFYDASRIFEQSESSAWVRTLYFVNPLAGILDSIRAVLFHGTAPDPITFVQATAMTLVVGAIGVRVFFLREPEFADYL